MYGKDRKRKSARTNATDSLWVSVCLFRAGERIQFGNVPARGSLKHWNMATGNRLFNGRSPKTNCEKWRGIIQRTFYLRIPRTIFTKWNNWPFYGFYSFLLPLEMRRFWSHFWCPKAENLGWIFSSKIWPPLTFVWVWSQCWQILFGKSPYRGKQV